MLRLVALLVCLAGPALAQQGIGFGGGSFDSAAPVEVAAIRSMSIRQAGAPC